MTEQEWMESKQPWKMFEHLRSGLQTSTRKERLLIEACGIVVGTRRHFDFLWGENGTTEASHQAFLLREIFGNPFQFVWFNSAWLTPTVKALAEEIYNDRAFDRMPVLGDALEEAGCTVLEVLEHCRNGREHVRGCWVVDRILGRE